MESVTLIERDVRALCERYWRKYLMEALGILDFGIVPEKAAARVYQRLSNLGYFSSRDEAGAAFRTEIEAEAKRYAMALFEAYRALHAEKDRTWTPAK